MAYHDTKCPCGDRKPTKRRILISNSGGETSGFMTWWLLNKSGIEADFIVVFSNTGKEREETLEFVRQCDESFGFNTVCVEAEVDPAPRCGTRHKVVSFDTASRNGEPFAAMIRKYGIPNASAKHCTRELKALPIMSYARSIGWGTQYDTAIGIRADEFDRISDSRKERRLIYPLISMRETRKPEILNWWSTQPFRLRLEAHQGNCDLCWKKSDRKLLTLIKECPERLKWCGRITFFRGNRSADDLLRLSKQPFEPWLNGKTFDQGELDFTNGCSESCEVF